MKPKFRNLLVASLPLACITHVQAQTAWIGASGGEWGTASNWDAGVPNASGAIANINTAVTVSVSDTTTAGTYPYTFGTLSANIATGSVVIGSTATTTDILKAAAVGSPEINVTTGGSNLFYYANLEGTQGLTKTGAGKFSFRFNEADQLFSGDIAIQGGIYGINQNSSLGNDNNDVTISGGARLLAEPGSNSGTITLPASRVIILDGTQSQIGSNNAAVNLVVEGPITETFAGNGLVKTDAGVVTLNGTLGYTGETRIAGGTLALAGLASLPTGQNLRFNGGTGTLDLGGISQTVRTIVMDNTVGNKSVTGGGKLTVNGDANLVLNASTGVTYSFAGIDEFTFNRATRDFVIPTVNTGAATLTDVNLASGGLAGGINKIDAANINIGRGNSDGANGNTARLHLGTSNGFNADSIRIGGFNAGGVVDFQAGLTSPQLKVRGSDGISAALEWKIGETSSGSRNGDGTVNLTGGSLDAVVTSLLLGSHIAGTNLINNTSSLTMPGGTLQAGTLVMAQKTGGGTPTLTATFTQEGGAVTIDTITMGLGNGSDSARLLPTYRLWGGTLTATTIATGGGTFAANSSRNLILRDGILINKSGADLAISGVTVIVSGVATTVVDSTAGQKVVLAGDTTYSARMNSSSSTAGALTVDGTLDLTASPAFGIFDDAPTDATALPAGTKLVLINYQNGSLTGEFSGLADGATVSVTKGAVTNDFVIDYNDPSYGGKAVTLTISGASNNYASWAIANGIGAAPFNDDFENDGISNGMEYALGTNPKVSSQPAGVYSFNTITYTKGTEAIANADVSWVIETSTTLSGTWTPEVTQAAGDSSATIAYTFTPGTPPKKFARLKVVKNP